MILPDCSLMTPHASPAAIRSLANNNLYLPAVGGESCVFPWLSISMLPVQVNPSASTIQASFVKQNMSMSMPPSLSRAMPVVPAHPLTSTSTLPCLSQVMDAVQATSLASRAGCNSVSRAALSACFLLPVPLVEACSVEVSLLVRKIKLYLQRFCCRRHDFLNCVRLLYDSRPTYPFVGLNVLLDVSPLKFLHWWVSHFKSHPHSASPQTPSLRNGGCTRFMGGGTPGSHTLKGSFLSLYCLNVSDMDGLQDTDFSFVQYATLHEASVLCNRNSSILPVRLPVHCISEWLTRDELRNMASLHNIRWKLRDRKPALRALLTNHNCDVCDEHISLFRSRDVLLANRERNRASQKKNGLKAEVLESSIKLLSHSTSLMNDKTVSMGPMPKISYSPQTLNISFLRSYCADGHRLEEHEKSEFRFVDHVLLTEAAALCK